MFKSEFSRNILKVFTGSAIAYLIGFLSLPLITRLYTAEDVGTYQLLLSIIILFSTVSALKFEMAIVLPEEDREANNVAVVTLLSVVVTTIIFSILFLAAGESILTLLNKSELSQLTGLIITGVFFNGIYLSMQYLYIRHKEFGGLSKNRIVEAGTTGGGSVLLGFLKFNYMGMFISKIVSVILASLIILKNRGLNTFRGTSVSDIKTVLKKYKKFPLVNTPMTLLNTLSLELPVFMISVFFDARIIGLYALARRVLSLPLSMIGRSFSQVYLQAASEAYNQGGDELKKVYLSTVKKLALIGILPVVVSLFAPYIFAVVFGSEWEEAGVYLQLMIFWLYFQFINSPIATTYSIINKQEIGLFIILISLILRFVVMYIFSDNAREMILALSIVTGVFYMSYNAAIYYQIRKLGR